MPEKVPKKGPLKKIGKMVKIAVAVTVAGLTLTGCFLTGEIGAGPIDGIPGSEAKETLGTSVQIGWYFGTQIYLKGTSEAPDLQSYSEFRENLLRLYFLSPVFAGIKEKETYDRGQIDDCADFLILHSAYQVWYFLGLVENNLRVVNPLLKDSSSGSPGEGEIRLSAFFASLTIQECNLQPTGKLIHFGPLSL